MKLYIICATAYQVFKQVAKRDVLKFSFGNSFENLCQVNHSDSINMYPYVYDGWGFYGVVVLQKFYKLP